ncbi:MAG: TRAP transporter small permease [Oscillibacter sp.]|nr:TRAP transporter small permease [Oscillibacter sp.]
MSAILEKIEKFVSCVCVSIMAVLVFGNVIARFVFDHSLAVSDEMSTYLFVLMSFMGTAIAARRGAHLGLSIVTDRLGENARKNVQIVMYGVSAFFCLLIVIFGVQMVVSQYTLGQETAAMQWPEWIYGSFVPIGACFAMIAFLQGIVNIRRYGHPQGNPQEQFSDDMINQAVSEKTIETLDNLTEGEDQ